MADGSSSLTEEYLLSNENREGHSPSIATLKERFRSVEDDIHAFLPEQDRWGRVREEQQRVEGVYQSQASPMPLRGVPVGIKDIVHVDGFSTQAGSTVPASELTGEEGTAIRRLRAAGAIILGKTVTTEFAYFDPGPTRNPHNTEHTPGGSSSGSAAAVAAGLCPLALGTQTIGSVIRPAAFCGIVGVKPSYGRIPIDGVLPLAPSVDHVGYFTADVASAKIVAPVLYDTWQTDTPRSDDVTIGVVTGSYLSQASRTGREAFQRHIQALETAGWTTVPLDPLPDIETTNDLHHDLVAAETADSLATIEEVYRSELSRTLLELIERGRAIGEERKDEARENRLRLRESIHECMADHGIDLICSPAAPGPAPKGIASTGDPIMNLPWTHAGLPTVTIPAPSTVDGLPLGLQLSGRFGADEYVCDVTEAIAVSIDSS